MGDNGGSWRSMAEFEEVWLSIAEYGGVQHCLAEHGSVWRSMAEFGGLYLRILDDTHSDTKGSVIGTNIKYIEKPKGDKRGRGIQRFYGGGGGFMAGQGPLLPVTTRSARGHCVYGQPT